MMRFWLVTLTVLFLLAPSAAEARKVALIIGNGDYANTSRLVNPANDIKIIAASAKQAGFDDVTIAADLAVNDFQKAMRDFRAKADGAEVAMVYYAGHGIEAQGKNWLIPTDAQLKSDLDLPYEAINLDRLMESVSGAQIRMVVLDSCRNNPFGRSWRSGTRAVVNGLAGVEADDVLVIFAAAPGQTAADGTSGNSPFATSLAKRLPQPDMPVQLLGGLIRDDVLQAASGRLSAQASPGRRSIWSRARHQPLRATARRWRNCCGRAQRPRIACTRSAPILPNSPAGSLRDRRPGISTG